MIRAGLVGPVKGVGRRLYVRTKRYTRAGLKQFVAGALGRLALPPGAWILNVGSGGQVRRDLDAILGNADVGVVGMDVDPDRGPDVLADVHRLPFAEGRVDVVTCLEVLPHLTHTRDAIGEMHRVLRPGGTLLLSVRFMFPMNDMPVDYYRFTEHGLREVLADFSEVEIRPQHTWTQTVGVILFRLLYESKRWVYLVSPLIYAVAWVVYHLPSGADASDTMTTGYFVRARKAPTEDRGGAPGP